MPIPEEVAGRRAAPVEYEAACEHRRELEPRIAIAEREEARRAFIRSAASEKPWHTSDGRYFASQADCDQQQRWLDERADRQAARAARVAEAEQLQARRSA